MGTSKTAPKFFPPFCASCGAHVGFSVSRCGACAKPKALDRSELRAFKRLVKRHWGNGLIRSLVRSPLGYRPCLVTEMPRHAASWSKEERMQVSQACTERAQLANLYDRFQASHGDSRRAVRS